ncbi:MAG TPA: hypothetical protein PKW82_04155 [Spirochaetales bacterium]|nr:hypothetical protein [Spirochaetales bacterium]
MKYGSLWRGLGLAALYIGIIVALVLIQFPREGGFLVESGEFALRAERAEGGEQGSREGGPIQAALLSFQGLTLEFSEERPLSWLDSKGTQRNSAPRAFTALAAGFLVEFEGGPVLRAISSQDGAASVSIDSAREASLSWRLSRGARLNEGAGGTLELSRSGSTWSLGIPAAALDRAGRTLRLTGTALVPAALSIAPAVAPAASPASPVAAFVEQAPMEGAAWAAVRSSYLDKTWAGLSARRWIAAERAWSDGSAGRVAVEPAAVAYLAEAWSRGTGPAAFERVAAVRAARPADFSWLSAPYFGDIVNAMGRLEEADLAEVRRIERAIAENSPSIFDGERFVPFLLDRTPYSLARSVFAWAQGVDPGSLDPRRAVAALEAWLDGNELIGAEANPFARFEAVAERVILPAVRKASQGYFYRADAAGAMDPRLGLRAGYALVRYGEKAAKPTMVGVGQSLVAGVLALADENGFLPAAANLKDGTLVAGTGTLAPEAVYDLVAGNPRYPRQVSFYRELGPGAWAWTVASRVTVLKEAGRAVYSFEHPVGYAHFAAVYGVAPYQAIRIHGIDYRMDPAFERYEVSGFNYKRASNSLYLKLRHRQLTEPVVFVY